MQIMDVKKSKSCIEIKLVPFHQNFSPRKLGGLAFRVAQYRSLVCDDLLFLTSPVRLPGSGICSLERIGLKMTGKILKVELMNTIPIFMSIEHIK